MKFLNPKINSQSGKLPLVKHLFTLKFSSLSFLIYFWIKFSDFEVFYLVKLEHNLSSFSIIYLLSVQLHVELTNKKL